MHEITKQQQPNWRTNNNIKTHSENNSSIFFDRLTEQQLRTNDLYVKYRKCKFKLRRQEKQIIFFFLFLFFFFCNTMLSYAYNQSVRRLRIVALLFFFVFFPRVCVFSFLLLACFFFRLFCFASLNGTRCQCTLFVVVNVVCLFVVTGLCCAIAYVVWPLLRSPYRTYN